MKYIDLLDKTIKKKKIVLLGCGKSLDTVDTKALGSSRNYDTCTISDAIKAIDKPTFAINYHYQGLLRIKNYVDKPRYLLLPDNIISFKIGKEKRLNHPIDEDAMLLLESQLRGKKNVYFFKPHKLKPGIIEKHRYPKKYNGKIYHGTGSIVGALFFLIVFMGYKEIYYVGFDGGINPGNFEYGQAVYHARKPNKEKNASMDYMQSWREAQFLLSNYPHVRFKPLGIFLKNQDIV